MFLSFEKLVQPHDGPVSFDPPEHVEFLHNFASAFFFVQEAFIDGFESDEFVAQPVNCQVYLPECTFPKHFADAVELYFSRRSFLT